MLVVSGGLNALLISAVLFFVPVAANAITAHSYIVVDNAGKVVLEKNPDVVHPIASITKLFVAEQSVKLSPDELIEILQTDVAAGRMRSTPLKVGSSYTRAQLTELALVSSDNVAAIALARSAKPETKRATLVEGSGLDPGNKSTARQLAVAARELYPVVGPISIRMKTSVGERLSTNPLLNKEGWKFYLSKTGFISQSGGCLVVVLEVADKLMTIAILGSSNTKQRWDDLIELRQMLGDKEFYVPIKVVTLQRVTVVRRRHR